MEFKNFLLDVDGVLAKADLYYTAEGKAFKVFGPDDHDALNMLRDRMRIEFISADKRGFEISKKRVVDDMKFELSLVSSFDRLEWMKSRFDLSKTIFMGDGIFDGEIFDQVGYAICPSDAFYLTKKKADFVTPSAAANRAVAEACVHILEKFFDVREIIPNKNYGVWKKEADVK